MNDIKTKISYHLLPLKKSFDELVSKNPCIEGVFYIQDTMELIIRNNDNKVINWSIVTAFQNADIE